MVINKIFLFVMGYFLLCGEEALAADNSGSVRQGMPQQYHYMDKALGVKFLHKLGLKGQEVTIGVIDTVDSSRLEGKVRGYKGALDEGSDPFSYMQNCHSSHVAGIICGRKIEGRNAIAPESKVYFKAFVPNEVTSKIPLKCNVTASEDWEFKEGTIPQGSVVTVFQPRLRYNNRFKGDNKYPPFDSYIQFIYQGKEWTPNLTQEQKESYNPNLHGCTGLYGDERGSFFKDLYPGWVTHVEDGTSIVDDHLSNLINSMKEKGIRIINFSIGRGLGGPKTLQALKDFAEVGGVFVVAAGNDYDKYSAQGFENTRFISPKLLRNYIATIGNQFPESILLVGNLDTTTDGHFRLHNSSTRAGDVKAHYIAAWGHEIPSIVYDKGNVIDKDNQVVHKRMTKPMTGTSQAAPMVSGIIADLYGAFPQCTPLHIKNVLLKTASTHGMIGTDDDYGQGRVDAKAAYTYLASNGCP